MLIATIPKNSNGEVIRVNAQTYRNKHLVDCRVFYQDKEGEWKPTRKGLCVTKDTIDALIAALSKAKDKLGVQLLKNPEGEIIKGWKNIAEYLGVSCHVLRKSFIEGFPLRCNSHSVWQYKNVLQAHKNAYFNT